MPGSLGCWFRLSALRTVKSWRPVVLPNTHPSISPLAHKDRLGLEYLNHTDLT